MERCPFPEYHGHRYPTYAFSSATHTEDWIKTKLSGLKRVQTLFLRNRRLESKNPQSGDVDLLIAFQALPDSFPINVDGRISPL